MALRSQARGLRVGAIAYQGAIAVLYNDIVRVTLVQFEYRGPAEQLFLCWGLKAGSGSYDNGANLALSGAARFASSRFTVEESLDWHAIEANLQADLRILAPLPAGRSYDTYVWLSRAVASMRQDDMVELADGAGMAPDTDANVVEGLDEAVQQGEARGLAVQYVRA